MVEQRVENIFQDKIDREIRIEPKDWMPDQYRKTLSDMFRRAGSNRELQVNWEQLLPFLKPNTWKHARDLTQFGLISFQPPASKPSSNDATNSN